MIPGSANPLLLKSAAAGGYQIERSLRFNSSDSASLSRASYAGSGTFSCWVKRCKLGTAQTIISGVAFNSSDQLNSSTAVFRDPSALMHVLVSTSGTYVNNTLVASGSAITPGIIGSGCDLYLADIHFIDGQALTPSSFTEVSATTGQLIPKAYTGSFGTNGFWLKFSDNSAATATTLGKDYSGNSNNWTPNNLSVTAGAGNDSLVDTPTSYGTDTGVGGEVRGNYCTWNPLNLSGVSLSNGNLQALATSTEGQVYGTFKMPYDKIYFELTSITNGPGMVIGVAGNPPVTVGGSGRFRGFDGNSSGNIVGDNWATLSSLGAGWAANDIIGIAYDGPSGSIKFYKNGSLVYTDTTINTTLDWFPWIHLNSVVSAACHLNWGQRPFAYTAPSGFKALCDTNLGAPLVALPSTVFNVITYTGTGSSLTLPNGSSTPTSISFTPDWVWIKGRSGATDHALYDAVRGVEKDLVSNSTAAETTQTTGLTAFGTNTFTVGSLAKLNTSSSTYVAWAWDAGTTTASNTQGSITSQVRANASAGFSVVTYTGNNTAGATVGHGLGVAPALIINKQRSGTNNWWTYHASLGATQYLVLDLGNAAGTANTVWNDTAPTSTVFSIGVTGVTNTNSATYVNYCFAPVVGYSSFGTYVANSSADGPFVYTGFRPKLVWVKAYVGTSSWAIYDSARNPYNTIVDTLLADLSGQENSLDYGDIDFLSNGFKIRSGAARYINSTPDVFIYCAWAENPFQYARAR